MNKLPPPILSILENDRVDTTSETWELALNVSRELSEDDSIGNIAYDSIPSYEKYKSTFAVFLQRPDLVELYADYLVGRNVRLNWQRAMHLSPMEYYKQLKQRMNSR